MKHGGDHCHPQNGSAAQDPSAVDPPSRDPGGQHLALATTNDILRAVDALVDDGIELSSPPNSYSEDPTYGPGSARSAFPLA